MLLFGVIAESQWNSERIVSLKPGESVSVRGYDLTLDGMVPRPGPNYRELVARFTVRRDGEVIDVLEPSKRTFPQREMSTTEAALLTRGASQLYLSLGELGIGRRDRGAALSQAAGAADLVRLRRDGARRRALALRPPPARRRAEAARARPRCSRRSRRCGRLAVVLASLSLLSVPAFAVQPDEILKDPALESRARAL